MRSVIAELEERVAWVVINGPSAVSVEVSDDEIAVGAVNAPAQFSVVMPPSPDDALELYFDPGPTPTSAEALDAGLSERLVAWAEGCAGAARLPTVISLLPEGQYAVVQGGSAPVQTETVLMGNEHVDRPAHVLDASEDAAVALWFGGAEGEAPTYDQPRVGLVLLNATGATHENAIWGLPLLETGAAESGAPLWIVPITGALVQDVMSRFGAQATARSRQHWTDTAAAAAVRRLAGSE